MSWFTSPCPICWRRQAVRSFQSKAPLASLEALMFSTCLTSGSKRRGRGPSSTDGMEQKQAVAIREE